jgi:hypothetical protein
MYSTEATETPEILAMNGQDSPFRALSGFHSSEPEWHGKSCMRIDSAPNLVAFGHLDGDVLGGHRK